MNGLIEREREINRWMQLRQRAVRHLRRQREDGRTDEWGGSYRICRRMARRGERATCIGKTFPHPHQDILKIRDGAVG